jgi:hypothetical protein
MIPFLALALSFASTVLAVPPTPKTLSIPSFDGNESAGEFAAPAVATPDAANVIEVNSSAASLARAELKNKQFPNGFKPGNPIHFYIEKRSGGLFGGGEEAVLFVFSGADRRDRSAQSLVARYKVCSFHAPDSDSKPKACENDGRAPQGQYLIDQLNRDSRYYLALHVNYPNAADKKAAATNGCSPGGDIMIHGGCASVGCFAMGEGGTQADHLDDAHNRQTREIFALAEAAWAVQSKDGIPLDIAVSGR